MVKQLKFRVNEYKFKVMNGELSLPAGKCDECNKRRPNLITAECHHIKICHECMTGDKSKRCRECNKKGVTYERIYFDPFI